MASDFQVRGTNDAALFTLRVHRGDGMALLAMNWRGGEPPADFVGFAIEYKESGGTKFFALKNRLGFLRADGTVDPKTLSTKQSPIQTFRWVQQAAETKQKTLHLRRPRRAAGDEPWRKRDFVEPRRIVDRELFS